MVREKHQNVTGDEADRSLSKRDFHKNSRHEDLEALQSKVCLRSIAHNGTCS